MPKPSCGARPEVRGTVPARVPFRLNKAALQARANVKRRSRTRPIRIGAALGSDLMLAPMVVFMRLPLMAAEAGNAGRCATESALAIDEKAAALLEGAFAAQRQFLFIANKAKKPDDRTLMELLKDLQASMEKTDEFRQSNRDPALKDSVSMVADGVGSLGWVTIGQGGGMKPHEHINELFGGAQMYGNKVLKEYRDKYGYPPPYLRQR